jgi:hypothetical protein
MKPIKFKEQNFTLGKPPNMSDNECMSLPCFRDGNQVISKWKLSEEEKAHVAEHGFIWISVLGGWSQPPILPQACETVFETVKPQEKFQNQMDRIMKEGTDGN